MYNPDKPIKTCDDDKIGRSFFSKQLAEAIREFPADNTFVVGLYGAWGSGKTSILNMTMDYLGNISKDSCDCDIIIVLFNPWNFTSCNQLIDQFFKTIIEKLDCKDQSENQSKIGQALMKYSSVFELTEYIPVVGKYLKVLSQLVGGFGEHLTENAEAKENNISLQKKKVIEALNDYPGKIVVVIDDIDRLPNEQIRLIFQLVTSVADFPHMIYLLSFDKKVVVNALKETQQCDGSEYLEKIIQVPFEVPFVKKETLLEILRQEFCELSVNEQDQTYDAEHWQNVFNKCISPYIRSFRDIKRYMNTLRFKFSPLRGEVNFIDFAGITALQVFATPVFEWIKHHKDDLLGTSSICLDQILVNDGIDLVAYYQDAFKKLQSKTYENDLEAVASLFQAFAINIEETHERTVGDNTLRNDLRIAYSAWFDLYFTLSLDEIVVSQAVLNRSIHEMDDFELRKFLLVLKKDGTITHYLYSLRLKRYTIPVSRIHLIAAALFNLDFEIHNDFHNNKEFQYLLHCQQNISELLLLIDNEDERCTFYCKLISAASPSIVWACAQHLYQFERSQNRVPSEAANAKESVFSAAKLELVESFFISRLREIAQEFVVFDWNHYIACSMIWLLFEPSTYEEYLRNLLKKEENTLRYIAMQMEASINPLDNNSIVYYYNEKLGYLIDKGTSRRMIQSSIDDHLIFALPITLQEKLAAYFVYLTRQNDNNSPPILSREAIEQREKWETTSNNSNKTDE